MSEIPMYPDETDNDRSVGELHSTIASLRAQVSALNAECEAFAVDETDNAAKWEVEHAKLSAERDFLRADLVDFYREAQGYTEGSPVDVLRQLKQRDEQLSTTRAALAEAERERERDEIVSAVIGAPQNAAVIAAVTEQIAAWLDREAEDIGRGHNPYLDGEGYARDDGRHAAYKDAAESVRANAWRSK